MACKSSASTQTWPFEGQCWRWPPRSLVMVFGCSGGRVTRRLGISGARTRGVENCGHQRAAHEQSNDNHEVDPLPDWVAGDAEAGGRRLATMSMRCTALRQTRGGLPRGLASDDSETSCCLRAACLEPDPRHQIDIVGGQTRDKRRAAGRSWWCTSRARLIRAPASF